MSVLVGGVYISSVAISLTSAVTVLSLEPASHLVSLKGAKHSALALLSTGVLMAASLWNWLALSLIPLLRMCAWAWTGKPVFGNGSLALVYGPPMVLTISGLSEQLVTSERRQLGGLYHSVNGSQNLNPPNSSSGSQRSQNLGTSVPMSASARARDNGSVCAQYHNYNNTQYLSACTHDTQSQSAYAHDDNNSVNSSVRTIPLQYNLVHPATTSVTNFVAGPSYRHAMSCPVCSDVGFDTLLLSSDPPQNAFGVFTAFLPMDYRPLHVGKP
ncbi:hypothetical protein B0H13DRAFT_1853398 [Mycena leptocephala]|nr:hypothetical protein B0H13DRAFT_1853398 [Mycena leptocephala]